MDQTYKNISVVIPNYNYSHYLKRRVKTILDQTYPIYELIILDDASTDDSQTVIKNLKKELKEKHIRTKIIINNKNSESVFKQWRKGFEVTTGDYIWIAEADDIANKSFLENVIKGFDDKRTILSYSKSRMINEKGRISFKRAISQEFLQLKKRHWKNNYINDGRKEIQEVLCVCNTIPNVSAVIFKKEKKIDYSSLLKKAQEFEVAGDWYFYYKILLHGKIAYCKKALNRQCIHQNSVTKKTSKEQYLAETKKIHELILETVSLDEGQKMAMKKQEEYLTTRFHL